MEPKNKYTVTLGLADCYRLKGDYRKALEHYSYVELNQASLRREIGIKKAISSRRAEALRQSPAGPGSGTPI